MQTDPDCAMTTTRPKAGRPKDESKRTAILGAAGQCFLQSGFTGTSMDNIARSAGVSKLTLYSHFEDKEALFRAMVGCKCGEFAPPETFASLADEDPRAALRWIGNGFLRLSTRPEVVAMHRLVVGEAAKDPNIAALMFEVGPDRVLSAFVELLQAWTHKGILEIRDARLAASNFFYMLRGELHERLVLGLSETPGEAEIKRRVDECVEVFLRAYARRKV